MDRYLLLVTWREGKFRSVAGGEIEPGTEATSLESTDKQPDLTATNIYHLLKRSISDSIHPDDSTFPACSVGGTPHSRKWFFAVQAICGFYQFCSSDWQEIHFDAEKDKIEDVLQANIEECQSAVECFEEDDSNSRESLPLADLYEESAENLHQLSDKLPAPGRAMIDIILLPSDKDPPKLKECLPIVGALKHLKEWHSAKVIIAGSYCEINCQKIAEYLSASVVPLEEFRNAIDPRELWRGEIQMRERKVTAFISSPCTNGEGLWTLLLVQLKSMPGSVREDVLDWHQVVEFSTVMQTVHLLLAVAPELHTATENCRSLVQLVQLLSFIRFLLGVMSVVTVVRF